MKHLLLIFLHLIAYQAFAQKFQLQVTPLVSGYYVHTSFQLYNNTPFPSNGLIVSTTEGLVLIDTGWGEEQTKQLLKWIKKNLKQEVVLCIATHAHEDRVGGIKLLLKKGIRFVSTPLTAQKTADQGLPKPEGVLSNDTTFVIGKTTIQTYFPGAGHTDDNIVVYFPDAKILAGGCLIKSYVAMGIGNIADANLKTWRQSVKNVQLKFPDTQFVIPGHEKWDSLESFSHTYQLIEKSQK